MKTQMPDNNTDPMMILRDEFKPIAKLVKAKSTYIDIYQKQGDYFWYVDYHDDGPSSKAIRFENYIKLWSYDELLFSIVRPGEEIRFTDMLRLEGFHAMWSYKISEKKYEMPCVLKELYALDPEVLSGWCSAVFDECYQVIRRFIAEVEEKYGDLNGFHIHNYERNRINAAFAHIARGEYEQALRLLKKAYNRGEYTNRCFGDCSNDLRDVLINYCGAQIACVPWTRRMVEGYFEDDTVRKTVASVWS